MDSVVDRQEVLAVIPARGGSKGIPRKNIRRFAGQPLIAWSIAAAKQSNLVTRVIVSTDDEEIAEVARRLGAEVPFLRPAELAQDISVDYPLFEHALAWLKQNENYQPDIVIQLRPTSPIRPLEMVDAAVQLLLDRPDAHSVRGVIPSGQNPYKMWRIGDDNRMLPLLTVEGVPEPFNAPRQQLPQTYWQTGHIDVIRTSTVTEMRSLSGSVILPYLVDPAYAVDIDSPRDWSRAEWLVWNSGLTMVCPGKTPRPLPKKVRLLVMDFDGVLTDNRVLGGRYRKRDCGRISQRQPGFGNFTPENRYRVPGAIHGNQPGCKRALQKDECPGVARRQSQRYGIIKISGRTKHLSQRGCLHGQ